jgi:NAD(P)H-dependent FMN reductase
MKITIISASMRAESQSIKVAEWLSGHTKTLGADTEILDLHTTKLPMFDDSPEMELAAKNILAGFAESDGFVFVSPEWNGTMSHGLVNLLHFVDHKLAHKPVMLVGVSGSRGGHYPLMQMRIMNYKNNHFVITPESLLVQDAKNVLNNHEPADGADGYVKKRADYALKVLLAYADSLRGVRSSGVVNFQDFENGV